MRTDDFEEIKPQDTDDGIPDVVQAEHERDVFDEFDAPPEGTKSGKSLGDIFRDNPFIKIAIVAVGIVSVLVAFVMFGGSGDDKNKSQVGTAVNEREAPGQETSQAYTDAIKEVNEQRYEQAVNQGTSTMPIQTNTPDVPAVPEPAEPPASLEDPLADWRASSQEAPPQQAADAGPPPPVINGNGMPIAPVAQGPDPAAVDALAQAMSQQMSTILQKHNISGPQIIKVTDGDKYINSLQPQMTDGAMAGAATSEAAPVEILIPAGTIVYAQTLTEANSDSPGPVLARITNGPLKGSKVLGTFEATEELLTLNFNTVVVKGISQSVNAVALDPKTTLPAVATEVDHRYLRRFILPAAARFIEGMGNAIAQKEQTVTVNNGTTVSSQSDLNTKEELAAGLAEGTSEMAQQLDDMASDTKVLVRVHAGTPIGLLFLEPVLKENQ
ncbi:MAG: DotG/IcmE/VirB10 family protein [Alphaproteobacteria bacterium]|nr:DotG/IcmE/VirB10 family protein [Alphaproteobacteria bacterium]